MLYPAVPPWRQEPFATPKLVEQQFAIGLEQLLAGYLECRVLLSATAVGPLIWTFEQLADVRIPMAG